MVGALLRGGGGRGVTTVAVELPAGARDIVTRLAGLSAGGAVTVLAGRTKLVPGVVCTIKDPGLVV